MGLRKVKELVLVHGEPHPSRPANVINRFEDSQCDMEIDSRVGIIRVRGLQLEGTGELPVDSSGNVVRKPSGREFCVHIAACRRWVEATEDVVEAAPAQRQGGRR